MELPTIRVEDTDSTSPTLALHYTLGSNSLDTVAISAIIHSLSTHPGRARFSTDTTEVTPRSAAFLSAFWSSAASLLDYFADFYATDTPLMQSVWFHLLDTWQAASPVALYERDHDFRRSSEAQMFDKDYKETLALVQRLISADRGLVDWRGQRDEKAHAEALIYAPSGKVEGKAGSHETGPFASGLKPWQQFLYAGAPGFTPASPLSDEEAKGSSAGEQDGAPRYIPQPAIALLQTHTARARSLLAHLALKQNRAHDLPALLAAFDATSIPFPSTTTRSHTLPSALRPGSMFTYQLVQGAPPVRRHEGLSDPSMMIECPDLLLLDEAVGNCKGREAYVPMTGPRGEEGVGFDVWAVIRREEGGWVSGERKGAVVDGEMFDEWYFEERK